MTLPKRYMLEEARYEQIRFYNRQYGQATEISTELKCQLDKLLDGALPGISKLLKDEKMLAFVGRYKHFDNIVSMGKDAFMSDYCTWAKEKGYRDNERKSHNIWDLVQDSIPCGFIMQGLRNIIETKPNQKRQNNPPPKASIKPRNPLELLLSIALS